MQALSTSLSVKIAKSHDITQLPSPLPSVTRHVNNLPLSHTFAPHIWIWQFMLQHEKEEKFNCFDISTFGLSKRVWQPPVLLTALTVKSTHVLWLTSYLCSTVSDTSCYCQYCLPLSNKSWHNKTTGWLAFSWPVMTTIVHHEGSVKCLKDNFLYL